MRTYRGYTIEHDRDHVVVTGPDGDTWTAEDIQEAEEDINEILEAQ